MSEWYFRVFFNYFTWISFYTATKTSLDAKVLLNRFCFSKKASQAKDVLYHFPAWSLITDVQVSLYHHRKLRCRTQDISQRHLSHHQSKNGNIASAILHRFAYTMLGRLYSRTVVPINGLTLFADPKHSSIHLTKRRQLLGRFGNIVASQRNVK